MRFFGAILGIVAASTFACQRGKQAPRPNIIVIMTDDHARNAVSAYGSRLIRTPNIDRIGNDGVRFTRAFVTNSLCGPSRAVLLSGKYSHLNGFRDNSDRFDSSQVTVPKLLQQAGYYTAVVGKWHLVSEPTGFDYWNILIGQGQYYNPDFVEMGDTTRQDGYCTDLVTDYAKQVLDQRPAEKPFCLFLNQKAPHRNWMPNLKHLGAFDTAAIAVPETYFDDYQGRSAAAREQDMEVRNMFHSYDLKLYLPDGSKDPGTGGQKGANAGTWWTGDRARFSADQQAAWDAYYKPISDEFYRKKLQGKELDEWKFQRYIRDYLSCVLSVDENVGRLFQYLKEKDLLENTLIVYTSDQGFFLGEHGWYDKRFMYEESAGMPLLMRWPEKIKKGEVNDNLVLNLDVAPTLLEAAQTEIPKDFQGASLLPLLNDASHVAWRSAIYYHYYEYPRGSHAVKRHYGIRTDRYKLIHFYNDIDAWELYDLKTDPHETNNLYGRADRLVLVDSLKRELELLRMQYLDTAFAQVPQP